MKKICNIVGVSSVSDVLALTKRVNAVEKGLKVTDLKSTAALAIGAAAITGSLLAARKAGAASKIAYGAVDEAAKVEERNTDMLSRTVDSIDALNDRLAAVEDYVFSSVETPAPEETKSITPKTSEVVNNKEA